MSKFTMALKGNIKWRTGATCSKREIFNKAGSETSYVVSITVQLTNFLCSSDNFEKKNAETLAPISNLLLRPVGHRKINDGSKSLGSYLLISNIDINAAASFVKLFFGDFSPPSRREIFVISF